MSDEPQKGHNSLDPKHIVKYAQLQKEVWALRKKANGLARESREIISDNGYDKGAVSDALADFIKKPHEREGYTESRKAADQALEEAAQEQPDLFDRSWDEDKGPQTKAAA